MVTYDYLSSSSKGLQGEITVPGDKSISHRAIMLGSIAQGTTVINGFLQGEDCLSTLNLFKAMGVNIEQPKDQQLVIHGVGKYGLSKPQGSLYCGNSGTTMRLMAGILSAQSFDTELTGDESLMKRPMERIRKPLTQMGAVIAANEGYPPLKIHGGNALTGIEYEVPVASAQVKSSLLLAGLYASGETEILETGITRDHTERMLTSFSYPIQKSDKSVILHGGLDLIASEINVPGDISSAAFFLVAASVIPGSELMILNVGINPTRIGVLKILELMGANITLLNKRLNGEEPVADLLVKYAQLEGIAIPAALVPLAIDEFPVLFIAAAAAKGQTLLHGAKELRFKESDRIAVMVKGLNALGIEAQEFDDGLYIQGGQLRGGIVDSHKDHRIAMAFAVAGAIAKEPVRILSCNNVQTSFPNFSSLGKGCGLNLEEIRHGQ